MLTLVFKMAHAMPHGRRTACQPRYAEDGGRFGVLMHNASAFSSLQSRRDAALRWSQCRRDAAFMPSMSAQRSKQDRRGAKGPPPVVNMEATPYIEIRIITLSKNLYTTALCVQGKVASASGCRRGYKGMGSQAIRVMPRSRGIPRRGGRSGVRVSSDLGNVQPISPINSAPPSSETDDSEQESLLPQGTYQSFRFRFPSRLVRPEVVVNFTVFITEEDPGRHNSSSPARAHDSDIFMGDMTGLVYRTRNFEAAPTQNALVQQASPPDVSGNDISIQEILQLPNLNMEAEVLGAQAQTDPGELLRDEDGMVIWLDSPSQDNGVQTDSTSKPA